MSFRYLYSLYFKAPGTACIIEVHQIKNLGYVGYNMPHVNYVIFSECKFALSFQRTTENHFGEQNHYFLKEFSIHNEYIKLVLKNSAEPHYRKLSAFCTNFYGNRNH